MADGDDIEIGAFNIGTKPTRLTLTLDSKASPVLLVSTAAQDATCIYGQSKPSNVAGSGSGTGVGGDSSSGVGVHGKSKHNSGVAGESAFGIGVKGSSGHGPGVFGEGFNKGSIAVEGLSRQGTGVVGAGAPLGQGVVGFAGQKAKLSAQLSGIGVLGISDLIGCSGVSPAVGVDGFSEKGFAIQGRSPNGWAGMFQGNVHIAGDLTVDGAKSAVMRFPDGSLRRLYAVESSESWFEDFGEARLVNGKAKVRIDRDFARTVSLTKRYHVFLTPHTTKIKGLAVIARRPDHFLVKAETGGGTGTFSYRIVARRRDSKSRRLERVKVPPSISASNGRSRATSTRRPARSKRASASSRRSRRRRSRSA